LCYSGLQALKKGVENPSADETQRNGMEKKTPRSNLAPSAILDLGVSWGAKWGSVEKKRGKGREKGKNTGGGQKERGEPLCTAPTPILRPRTAVGRKKKGRRAKGGTASKNLAEREQGAQRPEATHQRELPPKKKRGEGVGHEIREGAGGQWKNREQGDP